MATNTYIGQWKPVHSSTLPEGESREILACTKTGVVRQINSSSLLGMYHAGLVDGEGCQYIEWTETPSAPLRHIPRHNFHDRNFVNPLPKEKEHDGYPPN